MARVDLFFERASLEERTGLRRGTVVAEHQIRYRLPVVYSAEPLEVQIWVSDVRAAAFTCHYEVFDHGQLAVTGSTLLVPYDFSIARPAGSPPRRRTSSPLGRTIPPPLNAAGDRRSRGELRPRCGGGRLPTHRRARPRR